MNQQLKKILPRTGQAWGVFNQKLYLAELCTLADGHRAWNEFVCKYLGLPEALKEEVRGVVRERKWLQSNQPWLYVAKKAQKASVVEAPSELEQGVYF